MYAGEAMQQKAEMSLSVFVYQAATELGLGYRMDSVVNRITLGGQCK